MVFVPVSLFHAAGLIGLLIVTSAISIWLAHDTLRRPARALKVIKPKLERNGCVRHLLQETAERQSG